METKANNQRSWKCERLLLFAVLLFACASLVARVATDFFVSAYGRLFFFLGWAALLSLLLLVSVKRPTGRQIPLRFFTIAVLVYCAFADFMSDRIQDAAATAFAVAAVLIVCQLIIGLVRKGMNWRQIRGHH